MAFSDLPVRANGQIVTVDWFNTIRTKLISAFDSGIQPTQLTTSARNALTPEDGQIIWNTDDSEIQYYDGSTWQSFAPVQGLLPSYDTSGRDALSPVTGQTIWNTDNTRVEFYNGSTWTTFATSSVGYSAVRYSTNAGQSIPNATFTKVDFEDSSFDVNSEVTTGASWNFTPSANGYYFVTARVTFSSTTWDQGEFCFLKAYKGTTEVAELDRVIVEHTDLASTAAELHVSGSDLIYLTTSDALNIQTYQNTGSALTLTSDPLENYVAIYRVE